MFIISVYKGHQGRNYLGKKSWILFCQTEFGMAMSHSSRHRHLAICWSGQKLQETVQVCGPRSLRHRWGPKTMRLYRIAQQIGPNREEMRT